MLSDKLLLELKEYIEEHLVLTARPTTKLMSEAMICEIKKGIEDYIKNNKSFETFSTRLLKYIDELGVIDTTIYKAAGIDRRHFSKIRSNRDYKPSKPTVISLCLALNLSPDKADDLLKLAGYSLSCSETADLVVMFCIEKGIFNLMEVNEALEYFGQRTLG